MKDFHLPIVIEKGADGYSVSCPILQGCYSQGATYEEAIKNIEDAIRLHIQDRRANNELVVEPEQVSVSMLRFAM